MTTTTLPAGTWTLDPEATTITVTAKKLLGLVTVPATLRLSTGTVTIDDQHQVTRIDVTIDATSYDSGNPKRDTHVTGGDFLDAEQHPTFRFSASTVTASGDGHRCSGSVEVKGQTSPVELAVSGLELGEDSASFSATATLDRRALGVDKLPSFIIRPMLQLDISARATRS
ncbi:MAG: YceI family protein [Actinomycetota bacterium]